MSYKEINKAAWNAKAPKHFESKFYDVDAFKSGKSSLNSIELDLLGVVRSKSIFHLQCHFGQDSLSLSRMGAEVVGLDISDESIKIARQLNSELGLNAEFICCDLFEARSHTDQQFDIVFTSYGTIGWLPDLKPWAEVIAKSLKAGGKLVFADFHPVVWMFDDDLESIQYSYFNVEEISGEESGSYADENENAKYKYVCWNHSIAEVLQALLAAGLKIESFDEYDYSPYNCFRNTFKAQEGKYAIEKYGRKLPMVYSLSAIK